MLKLLTKIFGGSKSEKDVRKIKPQVDQINQEYATFQALSHDELRAKTTEFRLQIREHLADIQAELDECQQQIVALPAEDITGRDALYQTLDGLRKKKDKEIEVVLERLLPAAFAVVRETARRFSGSEAIASTATELDRELATKKEYITIVGDQSVFQTTWKAAGNPVRWNM
ncbi:MAG: preprotein translocase subunit SecA, partial [Ferruginibacter sp.]